MPREPPAGQLAPTYDWRWSNVLLASDYPFVERSHVHHREAE
jgi:hypothetical protein